MISDFVRTALKDAACELHLKRWDEMRIENDIISGIIKTEWNTYCVGGKSGVLFHAQIDCDDGTDYMINFLFGENDLARGAEAIRRREELSGIESESFPGRIPVPELYKFRDLRGPSRRVH